MRSGGVAKSGSQADSLASHGATGATGSLDAAVDWPRPPEAAAAAAAVAAATAAANAGEPRPTRPAMVRRMSDSDSYVKPAGYQPTEQETSYLNIGTNLVSLPADSAAAYADKSAGSAESGVADDGTEKEAAAAAARGRRYGEEDDEKDAHNLPKYFNASSSGDQGPAATSAGSRSAPARGARSNADTGADPTAAAPAGSGQDEAGKTASTEDLAIIFRSRNPATNDDSDLQANANQHVDYLSHRWDEEDIWASWSRVTKQKNRNENVGFRDATGGQQEVLENSHRLENASWRTWAKSRGNLSTISPRQLNWLKDCDVTWLYGPLLTTTRAMSPDAADDVLAGRGAAAVEGDVADNVSEKPDEAKVTNPYKPILKRRTVSQAMLLSAKAHAILEQQKLRHRNHHNDKETERSKSDTPSRLGSSGPSDSSLHSTNSANSEGSHRRRRRIHFNNTVQQCIAINTNQYSSSRTGGSSLRQQRYWSSGQHGLNSDEDDLDDDVYSPDDGDFGSTSYTQIESHKPHGARNDEDSGLSFATRRRGSSASVKPRVETVAALPDTTLKEEGPMMAEDVDHDYDDYDEETWHEHMRNDHDTDDFDGEYDDAILDKGSDDGELVTSHFFNAEDDDDFDKDDEIHHIAKDEDDFGEEGTDSDEEDVDEDEKVVHIDDVGDSESDTDEYDSVVGRAEKHANHATRPNAYTSHADMGYLEGTERAHRPGGGNKPQVNNLFAAAAAERPVAAGRHSHGGSSSIPVNTRPESSPPSSTSSTPSSPSSVLLGRAADAVMGASHYLATKFGIETRNSSGSGVAGSNDTTSNRNSSESHNGL